MGIANGMSLVGLVGSDTRKNYTAMGDIVNLADRLQKICPPGSVCIDRNTYQQISRWCRAQPLRRPLSKEDRELFERAQSKLDPQRREAIEEAMVKAFLKEEEAGYVAIKGKQNQVAIYELLGFIDPLENYLRVPREAAQAFEKIRLQLPFPLPEENVLVLEALEGSIGHAKVTTALSVAMAERMGLDDRMQKDIYAAAYLHDIGRFDLPERLLSDPRRFSDLTLQDQELLRGHVTTAEKILNEMNVPVSPAILEAIVQHHERYDGDGYPGKLKGEQIGIMARIIQLAEEYESLTSWRPYREKHEIPAALTELRNDVIEGKFDPKIGELFLKMLDSSLGFD
jgi:putative nucleotidyltransferase with HDIG domain